MKGYTATTTRQTLLALLLTAVLCIAPAAAKPSTEIPGDSCESIIGTTASSVDRMYYFVKQHNENFSRDVAETFFVVAERYGIRADVALCQAILETGWFKFMDGTVVTPDQYNYGGLGVTGKGAQGNSFMSMEEGVTALMQHLYAYACCNELPEGEVLVDKRFSLVTRGCAPTWSSLSGRWAMNDNYGRDILRLYRRMLSFDMPAEVLTIY